MPFTKHVRYQYFSRLRMQSDASIIFSTSTTVRETERNSYADSRCVNKRNCRPDAGSAQSRVSKVVHWFTFKKSRRLRNRGVLLCLSLGALLVIDDAIRQSSTFMDLDRKSSESRRSDRQILQRLCDTWSNPYSNLPSGHKSIRQRLLHPHVTCISSNLHDLCSYDELLEENVNIGIDCFQLDSIPKLSHWSDFDSNVREDLNALSVTLSEKDDCTLADPSYQNLSIASAPTCNDVHSTGLTFEALRCSLAGEGPCLSYIGNGGYNSVWRQTTSLNESFILKMHRASRSFSEVDFDRNRRDALISGQAGRSPVHYRHNVLPVYQYCAFTSIVPIATQTLSLYVRHYPQHHKGRLMNATEMFHLAFQAARGLYQSHLYLNGKATNAHSDVKPSQFLLFEPPIHDRGALSIQPNKIFPLLQLSDFNRCRLLQRSHINKTCPFRICGIMHKGSTYRSPEEYMDCADQTDAIDIFSLGGVFFYLLSDGLDPYYEIRTFTSVVEKVIAGQLPRLPPLQKYKEFGVKTVAFVKERANHPAFLALQRIMTQCWAYKPEERPSSLEVVNMFEAQENEVFMQFSRDH